jgi:hypothetical protein
MRSMVEGQWQGLVSYPSTTLRVVPLPTLRVWRMIRYR